jgi:2-phospho-L-lactate guanylyltransferase
MVTSEFAVLIPVKPVATAKSRLASLGDGVRRELVAAFVVDTADAASACPRVPQVLVVTDDALLARGLAALGIPALPDGTSGDLNASLRQGAAELARRFPALRPAALCADLPALRAAELGDLLAEVPARGAAFLADAAGVGTTFYTADRPAAFDPRFGPRSRLAHLESGARELPAAPGSSLRRDVDTPQDLASALALGVGARTRLVAARHGLLPSP